MPHKMILKLIFICLIALFVNACVTNETPKDTLSDAEKSKMYMEMGVRYMQMNMLREAQGKLLLALDIDANNGATHDALGVLSERLGEKQKAKQYYQNAIRLDPDSSSIINNYGRFLCENGDVDAGLELLQQAAEKPLNNRKWFAYTNIAICQLKKGDEMLAEGNFRQALQENVNFSPALAEMQKISYKNNKYMSARAFLERYLAVAKHTAETLWYAVQTERALGNRNLAESYREKLFSSFPASKQTQQIKSAMSN